MKYIAFFALLLNSTSNAVLADSETDLISPTLVDVKVSQVEEKGKIITNNDHLFIAIPVEITTKSDSIKFVGHETRKTPTHSIIQVKGATNPLEEIREDARVPQSIHTLLTLPESHFPKTIGKKKKILEREVIINGSPFLVKVDRVSEDVTIIPSSSKDSPLRSGDFPFGDSIDGLRDLVPKSK